MDFVVGALAGHALPNEDAMRVLQSCLPLAGRCLTHADLGYCLDYITQPGAGRRWMLPLLAERVGATGDTGSELLPKLRAARLYEEQRGRRFDAIAGEAIEKIAARTELPIVSRGLALSQFAYPARAARHSHDLDLIVADMAAARAAMKEAGFEPVGVPGSGAMRHVSDMTATLHTQPLPLAESSLNRQTMLADGGRRAWFGTEVFAPANHHLLAHTILLAAMAPARRLAWIADAWFAIDATSIDWSKVSSVEGPDALWLYRGLRLLQTSFDATLPDGLLNELRNRAGKLGVGDMPHLWQAAGRQTGRRALIRHLRRQMFRPASA